MYKILISYKSEHNIWKQYGTTTDVAPPKSTAPIYSFTEFETDDIEVLKEELLKISKDIGFENIKVYQDVTAKFSVDIIINESSEEGKDGDNSIEIDADKKPDLEI